MGYVDLLVRRERTTRSVLAYWVDVAWCNPLLMLIGGLVLAVPYSALMLPVLLINDYNLLEMIPWLLPTAPGAVLILRSLWLLWKGDANSTPPRLGGEKQLLMALRDLGGITPVEAALETSLSVDEAEEILTRLADRGHLRLESRGDALVYVLPGRGPTHQ